MHTIMDLRGSSQLHRVTPLHKAAQKGDLPETEALLQKVL